MGKKKDPDEKPEDLKVEVENPTDEKPTVEIDLQKEKAKEDGKDNQPDLDKYFEELKKERKRSEYLNRKLEKYLEKLNQAPTQKEPEKPTNTGTFSGKQSVDDFSETEIDTLTPDQINEIAQENWQLGVDLRTAKVLRSREKKEAELRRQQSVNQTLESSKSRVRQRYPQLDDDASEESKMYIEILNENPALLQNPMGPELAMYRMEEKMRAKGVVPPPYREQYLSDVDRETQRRQRIGAGSLPHGSPSNSGDKVTLTQEQINMAKNSGIPLSQFAQSYKLSARDFKEGVTVDE